MHPRPAVRPGWSALASVALTAAGLAGCGDGAAPTTPTPTNATSAAAPSDPGDARVALAALAALAQDRAYTALYSLDVPGHDQRSVVATMATDGSRRVDIPGGALGGTADVSIVHLEAGVFQCALPSATRPASTCVKVADRNKRVPSKYDPKVQRVFHDYLAAFTDRQAPLSVSTAQPLDGAQGSCFAVESTSVSVRAPVDVGIYCFADDGCPVGAAPDLTRTKITFA
jgi:hypothetical protein